MVIRYAKRDELDRVNELRRVVNDVHVEGRPDIFTPGFCKELHDHVYTMFESEDSDIIVALADDVICGFASVQYILKPKTPFQYERKFYRIEEFCVDEAFRRRGVATAMIDFCKSEAKAKGFERVEIDVWEFNEGARACYEAAGFKVYRRFMEMDI